MLKESSHVSIIQKAQDLQDRIEAKHKQRKLHKKLYADICRNDPTKKKKWIMPLTTVKKYRKLYVVEAVVALSIPPVMILLFHKSMYDTVVGSMIVAGCGLFFISHFILTLMMDYAIYKRDKKENSWFFSKMDDVKEL
jgi:hypothetical protein